MSDIYDFLAEMPGFAEHRDWDGLEERFCRLAVELAGREAAGGVAAVDLTGYERELALGLRLAVRQAQRSGALAVYFEYNLENGWSGDFFVCDSYNALSEHDDDWACEYSEVVTGPNLPMFAQLYKEVGGFDRTPIQTGTNLFLIARTVSAFGRACDTVASESLCICIAFHDQDPILRIRER